MTRRPARPWVPPELLRRWYRLYILIGGILALIWVLVRTGTKPSRLAYPCQQAALSTATVALGATMVGGVVALRRRLTARWLTPVGIVLGIVALTAVAGVWSEQARTVAFQVPLLDPPADYTAKVFSETDCPQQPLGDRFVCVEDLFEKMGAQGIKLHRSSKTSITAGPQGILGADDVVLIKINYQWPERGGTNTDLLRGLIRRILDHPDGFAGEIVIAENTQFASIDNFDRNLNNAQDVTLSPHDVVQVFRTQSQRISHYSWTDIRYNSVDEYSDGDMNDGYVVYPYDALIQGRVSYPKFETVYGTRISLKHGIWDGAGYDREKLKLINVPVLKSHHAVYGATALVKNYMGLVTRELQTNSHNAIRYGLLGATIGEIQPADLNLLDAIWINANPYDGPWTDYGAATRTDRLLASLDPVAADLWAVKHILIPAFVDNGYSPPWPYPSADPDDPASAFRTYLDASMSYILAAGYDVTNDEDRIDAIELGPPGEVSDPTGMGVPFRIGKVSGGYELSWSVPYRGGPVDEYVLYRVSLDGTGLAECEIALGTGIDAAVSSLTDNRGFLVVARNAAGDGSLGRDSRGVDRAGPVDVTICP